MDDETKQIYRQLRQHLNSMPVGFPRSKDETELELLAQIFNPIQAEIALYLTYRFEPLSTILSRSKEENTSKEEFQRTLDDMVGKCILAKTDNHSKRYALAPYVTGMYELNWPYLTREFVENMLAYGEKFFFEYLATDPQQTRIIPIEEALSVDQIVTTYDNLSHLIQNAKTIRLAECACKKGRDLLGQPCKVTKRREICLYLGSIGESMAFRGIGREISRAEALEIARESEQEGLVLHVSNTKEVTFVCACCSCCCGILGIYRVLPRPRDFVVTNYVASIEPSLCKGCGTCVSRCQMSAVTMGGKKAEIQIERCIGCGLCVPTCPTKAITLKCSSEIHEPPDTEERMYDEIMSNKKSNWQKLRMILQIGPFKLLRNVKKQKKRT